ncbi:hypothetical protein MRB53_042260 [Persea americana]|nr:hypothetical protein MRB53_042260 [Persea americana]
MSSFFARSAFDSSSSTAYLGPLLLFTTSLLAPIHDASSHSLLIDTFAWSALCIICTWRTGVRDLLDINTRKLAAYGAGLLWAVSELCERAVDGENLWWTKAFLPVTIQLIISSGVNEDQDTSPTAPAPSEKERSNIFNASLETLPTLTLCALAATWQSGQSHALFALGLSYAFLSPLILLLIERGLRESTNPRQNGNVIYSTSGLITQVPQLNRVEAITTVLRDVAFIAATISGVAAIAWESWNFTGLTLLGGLGKYLGDHWVFLTSLISLIVAVVSVPIQATLYGALVYNVHTENLLTTSLLLTAATICIQLITNFTFRRFWFSAIFATVLYFLREHYTPIFRSRTSRAASIITIVSFVAWIATTSLQSHTTAFGREIIPADPAQPISNNIHPMEFLTDQAQFEWKNTLLGQSQTLEDAVKEYRSRYSVAPPPHFDKWFEYAKQRDVKLIDEYDTIYNSLLPFWSLPPTTIRNATKEILGFKNNNLIAISIREGKVIHIENGVNWQQQATVGMIEKFVQHLPDMDLAFNIHDEPRVVVPHDILSGMVATGIEQAGVAARHSSPRNTFSKATDLNNGQRVEEVKTTRFNVFAHQPVWQPSRLSCAAQSPARAFEGTDNITAYALGELGFIYNHTAFQDICNTPSLAYSHGFFDRPNAFNVIHDLVPIFSQSKMSSFQDILYPSPWYWYPKVRYQERHDMSWDEKEEKMWWRGSTTGGFSRDGGWRRQHRQHFVAKVNANDQAKVLRHLTEQGEDLQDSLPWVKEQVPSSVTWSPYGCRFLTYRSM